ncbi:glycosyltransferase [Paracoccus albicereus]|nr:glycosyltransferase [Paracoccus albicereus]
MPIVILMAVYNGARHMQAQLDSIAAQDHQDWSLIVGDDGSDDDSRKIVDAFAASQPGGRVRRIDGPRAGATANFLHLVDAAPEGCALAFCDQDDVWLRDKLARAASALASHGAGAAHYSARTIIAGPDLKPLGPSPRFTRPFGLRNALVQACTAGNTSVFSPSAAAILRAGAGAARRADVVSHDWWAYQLIAASGGSILKDDQPVLLYRQHGGNEMGRNDTWRAKVKRLGMLFDGDFGRWMRANVNALQGADDLLTPEARDITAHLQSLLAASGPKAAAGFAQLGLYRHEAAGTAALYLAAAAGRLRQRG